jgi:glycosyltransferase involved in cell wall biosynthesis
MLCQSAAFGYTQCVKTVLIVHSKYATGDISGENRVVEQQIQYLRTKGYNVQLFIADTSVLSTKFAYKFKASLKVIFKPFFDRKILSNPELFNFIILHNMFPNIGTAWLRNCSVPIIRFHHNYRDFCANGLLFRNGQSCTLCLDGKKQSAVIHGCYRNSRLATIPLAIASTKQLQQRLDYSVPSIHVAVSPFQAKVMIQAGYVEEEISILRNFAVNFSDLERNVEKHGRWLAVGRLEQGKGFLELIKEWPSNLQLDIFGIGKLFIECQQYIEQASLQNIRMLGFASPSKLREVIPSYLGGVIPGLTREPAPLVFPELLAAGLPVIALANTSSGEMIQQERCGVVLRSISKSEISQATLNIVQNYQKFSSSARKVYEMYYSADVWSKDFDSIIEKAISLHK